jgi:hypothetical protein
MLWAILPMLLLFSFSFAKLTNVNRVVTRYALNINEDVYISDIVSVIGRFRSRKDFLTGDGYERPPDGLLTKQKFYDRLKNKDFIISEWPKTENGELIGTGGLSEIEIEEMKKNVSKELSIAGCNAIFTSLAKGATNGVCYPIQADEEMHKWLDKSSGKIDIDKFELSLSYGKLSVVIGWFLYIGLQFVALYVIFFVPIMKTFFPDTDFYPVDTFLRNIK